MNVSVLENYTFDKAAKTVTFTDFTTIDLSRIISIIDVTNGLLIYTNNNPSYIGTVATNVITLGYDTNNDRFNNTDKLYIEYVTDNYGVILLPSTVVSATGQTGTITNYSKGVTFFINATAKVGTPSIVVKAQMLDIVSGSWIDIPGAVTSAITDAGQTILTVYPGVTAAANVAVSFPMPRKYRIVYTLSSTTSLTFSIVANYLN